MELQPFQLERWQSTWENQVEYNLSESGIEPLKAGELLDGETSALIERPLGYSQTNGTKELRTAIAALYQDATADNILVTNGSSEAIFVTLWSFLDRGAEIAVMLPNYMQVWGLAKALRARVRPIWLKESKDEWSLDLRELRRVVNRRTKLIAMCNPNNPTGAVLRAETVRGICDIAKKAGAWVLSDDVYHGAELDGQETPTFWGNYEKVIVTNGLSKAYGLPGLRVGWAVAPRDLLDKLWSYHDYTTIGPSALSDYMAQKALQPEKRTKILQRTRDILRSNLQVLSNWIGKHHAHVSFVPPKAGAIAYLKYSFNLNSTRFAERLLREKSTLIVPGDHFGMDHYLRIGYGMNQAHLIAGLERVGALLSIMPGRRLKK